MKNVLNCNFMAKRLVSPVLTDAYVPASPTQTSSYPLNWMNVFSAEFGKLHVICCEEVLPKDHWKGSVRNLVRFEPLIKPLLSEVNVFTHFFFIPNRILWDGWEEFISGVESTVISPTPAPKRTKPYFIVDQTWPQAHDSQLAVGSLADFIGVNITGPEARGSRVPAFDVYEQKVDLMPFIAFQAVYDHWYRDKNFSSVIPPFADMIALVHDGVMQFDNGDDERALDYFLNNRGRNWEPDYFTSALPWPQRHESVLIPFEPYIDRSKASSEPVQVWRQESNGLPTNGNLYISSVGRSQLVYPGLNVSTDTDPVSGDDRVSNVEMRQSGPGAYLDFASTLRNLSSIEDLRVARILQSFREIEGYADNDYQGQIEALFGVNIPDYRVDKPELIGGGRQPVNFDAVMQTSATSSVSAQGNLAGHGYSVPTNCEFEYRAYEHGWIIGIMTIMPRVLYCQGLHRKFQRFDRFDYAWPQFATLGAQEIKTSELYINEYGDKTFGYTERYMEYKTHQNEIHGTVKTSDDFWTLHRSFSNIPILEEHFLLPYPDQYNDIFADPSGNNIFVRSMFNCRVERALPFKATPLL